MASQVVDLEARLLEHLRKTLALPRLEYAERPSRVTGGFDTQIFAFRLTGAPTAYTDGALKELGIRLVEPPA